MMHFSKVRMGNGAKEEEEEEREEKTSCLVFQGMVCGAFVSVVLFA